MLMHKTSWVFDLDGIGVKKDEEKAISWYVKAAELGHALAQYQLDTYSGKTTPNTMQPTANTPCGKDPNSDACEAAVMDACKAPSSKSCLAAVEAAKEICTKAYTTTDSPSPIYSGNICDLVAYAICSSTPTPVGCQEVLAIQHYYGQQKVHSSFSFPFGG